MSKRKDDDDCKEGSGMQSPMDLVCVNCGKFVRSVYIEYSPGNIRLSNCANCGGIVDKYVEYEIMIVIIDVILHKYEVYRHIFFNYPRLNRLSLQSAVQRYWILKAAIENCCSSETTCAKALVWKATLCSLFLDTWRWTSPDNEHMKVIEWDSPPRFFITAGKVVVQVGLLNCAYLFAISLTLNMLSKSKYSMKSKYMDVFLAVLLSSHFKFFVFGMMVWEFSFLMGLMVDLLMLTSNLVALEVMLNASRFHAATAVMSGALSKYLMVALLRYNW